MRAFLTGCAFLILASATAHAQPYESDDGPPPPPPGWDRPPPPPPGDGWDHPPPPPVYGAGYGWDRPAPYWREHRHCHWNYDQPWPRRICRWN